MKITIDGIEIEIKAKRSYESRASKSTTMNVLNIVAICAREAAEKMDAEEFPALKKRYMNICTELHEILENEGLYK